VKQYLDILDNVLTNGSVSSDRTGVGTIKTFGEFMKFDLSKGFPMVTTKKLAFGIYVAEVLWYIEGSTDERRLAELTYMKDREEIVHKNTIWTANADNQGKALGYTNCDTFKELGPVYGHQFRNCSGIDQFSNLIKGIKKDPYSRRHVLNLWNVEDVPKMALPPCHTISVFNVIDGKLNCHLTQRSGDLFLGIPSNIMNYSLLTHIIARECDLEVGQFAHTIVDAHIYSNHVDQVKEQLKREPKELPTLVIDDKFDLNVGLLGKFALDTKTLFKLEGYDPYPTITAPMAV